MLYHLYDQIVLNTYLTIINYLSLVSVSNDSASWNLYMVATEAILIY